MNDYCPKINKICVFCVKTEIGEYCGLGIRINRGHKVTLINRIKDMPECPKLRKKGLRK